MHARSCSMQSGLFESLTIFQACTEDAHTCVFMMNADAQNGHIHSALRSTFERLSYNILRLLDSLWVSHC